MSAKSRGRGLTDVKGKQPARELFGVLEMLYIKSVIVSKQLNTFFKSHHQNVYIEK